MSDSKYLHLVTASTGTEHVSSADDGSLYAALVGRDQYVLYGFDAEIVDSNNIRIKEGDLLINGRHAKIDHGDSVIMTIENGTVGTNRVDLIVVTYTNNITGEGATIDVIKGTSTTGTPVTPSYNAGSILNGDTYVQMPLYAVVLDGINIKQVNQAYMRANTMQTLYNMIVPPVGWIEYNESGVNPSQRYPGTVWELAGKGAVAVCIDTADSSLKNAGTVVGSNTLKLENKNLPKHTHNIGNHTHDIPVMQLTTAAEGEHTHKAWYKKLAASGSAVSVYQTNNAGDYSLSPREFTYPGGTHKHAITIPANRTTTTSNSETGENVSGSATPISTMQKSYIVYRWKRTR